MKKYLFIALGAIIFAGVVITPFLIKVTTVCKDQFGGCIGEVAQKVSKYNGASLVTAQNGIKKALKSDYLISDFSLQFKLPDILEVNIISKKPAFALFSDKSSRAALIDSEGTVLAQASDSALPKVIYDNDLPKTSEKVGPKVLSALNLVAGTYEMYQTGTGRVTGEDLMVDLPGGVRAIFPLDSDRDTLLGALRLIYTKVTSAELAGKFSEIDLRFKNPVLR